MNKEGYVVTCNKCGSSEIKFDYLMTTFDAKKEFQTPVECKECGYATV